MCRVWCEKNVEGVDTNTTHVGCWMGGGLIIYSDSKTIRYA